MELFPLIFYPFLSFENESKVYDTDFTLVPIQKSFFQAFHNWFNLDIFGLLWWGPFSGGVLSPAVYRPSRLFLKHFGTVYKFINCTPKILIFDPSMTILTFIISSKYWPKRLQLVIISAYIKTKMHFNNMYKHGFAKTMRIFRARGLLSQ